MIKGNNSPQPKHHLPLHAALPERRGWAAYDVELVAVEGSGVHHLKILITHVVVKPQTLYGWKTEGGCGGSDGIRWTDEEGNE